ncbi:MAG: pyrroline-5-carboxylate reductase [Ruminococcaceae bacterium]|nr:pyrroline-5-carboxylate reductase [Oscillospiraceae bacterium]
MIKYGFIGAGNMATAFVYSLIKQVSSAQIGISSKPPEDAERLTKETGTIECTNLEIAKNTKYLVLAVKPQHYDEVLKEIKDEVNKNNPIIVTMAAGKTIASIHKALDNDKISVIRIMPNTPVKIGKGTILIASKNVTNQQLEEYKTDHKNAGRFIELDEDLIDAGSVISGCGPAFVFQFMEAEIKAGMSLGLDKETATILALETAKGTATLAIEEDKNLEDLRESVCSKGGSTIEGVESFKQADLDGIVKEALTKSFEKTLQLGKE